jgi:hypothetical protein
MKPLLEITDLAFKIGWHLIVFVFWVPLILAPYEDGKRNVYGELRAFTKEPA